MIVFSQTDCISALVRFCATSSSIGGSTTVSQKDCLNMLAGEQVFVSTFLQIFALFLLSMI